MLLLKPASNIRHKFNMRELSKIQAKPDKEKRGKNMSYEALILVSAALNTVTGAGLIAAAFKGFEERPLLGVAAPTVFGFGAAALQIVIGARLFDLNITQQIVVLLAGVVGACLGAGFVGIGFKPSPRQPREPSQE